MNIFLAHKAKQNFGDLLRLAREAPVAIWRYNRPAAYVLSPREYREFQALREQSCRAEAAAILDEIDRSDDVRTDMLALLLQVTLGKAERLHL